MFVLINDRIHFDAFYFYGSHRSRLEILGGVGGEGNVKELLGGAETRRLEERG
jgi:hypothetical protein